MPGQSQRFIVPPAAGLAGQIRIPGDKSISHRALMLGAIANGTTEVQGILAGDDCLATMNAMRALGVSIDESAGDLLRIEGRGLDALHAPAQPLDLGNSGTAIRLLTGLLAGQAFDIELTGDRSLRTRPMQRVAEPLGLMGAHIETTDGKAPLLIRGGSTLHGVEYDLPVASAQVKSALLLAAMSARGTTTLHSPGPTRDHTERMLRTMGASLTHDEDSQSVSIEGPVRLNAATLRVPGDFSSAAFFVVAACFGAASGLLIENIGVNPTRVGLLRILEHMGADIELRNPRAMGAEPIADLYIKQSELRGIDVPPELVSLSIDEFPILFIAAAGASGRTTVRGAEELRHKETDRLAVMARALTELGIAVEEHSDGLTILGGQVKGGVVDSGGDHRVAMACAIASLLSTKTIEIDGTEQVATSFPDFAATAGRVGIDIDVVEAGAA